MSLKLIISFACVLFAHYIGDSLLQTKWMTENKPRLWHVMMVHSVIWAGCICVALFFWGLFALWKVLFLIAGHWISDKLKTSARKPSNAFKYNLIDQAWHVIQCTIVWLL